MAARWLVLMMAITFLAGCGWTQPQKEQPSSKMVPVSGQAKIVAIDQTLGQGTMEVDGNNVTFWWENRVQLAARGDNALSAPDMTTVAVPFNVNVGDQIAFKGFKTNGEIFVTAAYAIKR